MLHLSVPLFHTSMAVIFNSGFCDLGGIVEMQKHGLFGQALIKKR